MDLLLRRTRLRRGREHLQTGMAFLIAGFAELIWWSSPSFFMGGAHSEYELLLINKITISLIGLGLLHGAWHFRTRWEPKTT